MTEDYQKQITERIRDGVNRWIGELKEKHPELLLTRQWKIAWPKGFTEGHNMVPVVTSCKQGQYLVGEVQFVLPPSMDLDPEAIDLKLMDEPYRDIQPASQSPGSLDDPLDMLNDLISGINGFLQSLAVDLPQTGKGSLFTDPFPIDKKVTRPLNIHNPWDQGTIKDSADLEEVKRQMRRSPYLPDWYESIQSREVADDLLRRLAEGYLHYQRQVGRGVSLEEYFKRYTDYLQKEGKLHHYCKYKGKPVRLDSDDWCTGEPYCSKKPFHSECPQVTMRFGAPPED